MSAGLVFDGLLFDGLPWVLDEALTLANVTRRR
jgi:hypothetical protein